MSPILTRGTGSSSSSCCYVAATVGVRRSARTFLSSSKTNHKISSSRANLKIQPQTFFEKLASNDIKFHSGVPDSLLKDYCAYVTDKAKPEQHVIAANEGTALATACGYHLASRQIPVVYLQNSGFGNIVNPLLSLISPKVYKIPVLFLIGWRGEPGVKDEPQHAVMGRLQEELLKACELPYAVLPTDEGDLDTTIKEAVKHLKDNESPYALLVRKGTFDSYKLPFSDSTVDVTAAYSQGQVTAFGPVPTPEMTREKALEVLLPSLSRYTIVSTTGFLSRELYEVRERHKHPLGNDFMCVGSMGHASAIAHGIALGTSCAGTADVPREGVLCLDGDGAALMHLGQMAINGTYRGGKNKKLVHVLVNNGLHESVGAQPTVGFNINFPEIAKACGYQYTKRVSGAAEILESMEQIAGGLESSYFLEIIVKPGARGDLGRPKSTPEENKREFMKRNFCI